MVRRLFGLESAAKRGSAALRSGRFDDAVEAFNRAIEHTPTSSAMWFNLGLVQESRRDWQASLGADVRAADFSADKKEAVWNAGALPPRSEIGSALPGRGIRSGFEHGETGPST
jgi:hypothetical protein